jgi:subtilisin family serine protease
MPPRWPRRPRLASATTEAGVITVRERDGRTGDGATICIVDTGLDLGHRDFRDADDRTRVRWLFDFESPPRGVHEDLEARFSCAVFRGDELDGAPDAPGDRHGHGTAVAAVAAGDDAGPGEAPGPYAGAAPGASLVVVKLPIENRLGFSDELIALGTEACFAVDDPLRTVAVLSFGGHDGRHDGTEPLDVALDALSATGARVVVAAGNDGDAPIHATGTLGQRATVRIPLLVPRPEPADDMRFVAFGVIASASTRVSLEGPDGTRAGPVAFGERADVEGSRVHIVLDGTPGDVSGNRGIYGVVGGVGSEAFGGDYTLIIEVSGRFDVWILDHDLGEALLGPRMTGPFVEPSGTVTIPGTAPSVLTVGASITYTRTTTDTSEVRIDGDEGAVAPFSSVGPPPFGRAKPDLVAPGALVVTALSADVVDGDPENLFRGATGRVARHRIAPDRIALSGTSFTAPLAAGVLALGLSDDTDPLALDRLRFSARPFTEDGDVPWSGRGGFGALDAEAYLGARSFDIGARLTATAPVDLAAPRLFVAGRVVTDLGPHDGPVELFIDGNVHGRIDARAGVVRAFVPPPPLLPGQTVTLEARVDGVTLGEMSVRGRIDAARDRAPPTARGGSTCGVASTRSHPDSAFLFLIVVALARLLKARSKTQSRNASSMA